eukprot:CAMPEP_0170344728 /NCGR_PEP_ID=MMETSP0116_2-20130129/73572_1 /TAXON_ID=400756 /ORGANISM="Durinskia baltica, Strain CSIRO CS-38" /LENGTH=67 /DNA_ID=CAMNT_0010598447 /DNA_START=5 /DNA_END=204 /DNA_ORIENTATION=+
MTASLTARATTPANTAGTPALSDVRENETAAAQKNLTTPWMTTTVAAPMGNSTATLPTSSRVMATGT